MIVCDRTRQQPCCVVYLHDVISTHEPAWAMEQWATQNHCPITVHLPVRFHTNSLRQNTHLATEWLWTMSAVFQYKVSKRTNHNLWKSVFTVAGFRSVKGSPGRAGTSTEPCGVGRRVRTTKRSRSCACNVWLKSNFYLRNSLYLLDCDRFYAYRQWWWGMPTPITSVVLVTFESNILLLLITFLWK